MSATLGKPSYQQSDCPLCKERAETKAKNNGQPSCADCKKVIPQYVQLNDKNTPTIVNNGFDAPEVDHWHFAVVTGVNGNRAVNPPVCRDCYFKQYTKMYPARKLKLSELPGEMVYK